MRRRPRRGLESGATVPTLSLSDVPQRPAPHPMTIHSDNPKHGFQFPGRFELSAMGGADDALHAVVPGVLQALGLTVYHETLRIRPSAKGNYVSVSVSFEAHSREDYDAAHGALRARPEVKWTL